MVEPDASSAEEPSPSRETATKSSSRLAWRALRHRAALAALEFGEARRDVLRMAMAKLAVLLLAQLALGALAATLMAWSWDTAYRVLVPGILAGVFSVAAGGTATWCHVMAKQWRPFDATRTQLAKDGELWRVLAAEEENRAGGGRSGEKAS